MKKKLKLNNKFFPVNEPLITEKDIKSVVKILKAGWVSSDGPEVKKFEAQLSKKVGKKYGICVSNGTTALEIAIKSLKLKKGSEIIIPNFTIISSALAVIKNNCIPVLIDCDRNSWNMNLNEIKKKINKKTKCIIATHIYGYPIEIEKIKSICKKKNIFLIEDAAEMLGHRYKNKQCGFYGDLSIFSFYANKHITTGEGGMILTNSKKHMQSCKSLRNLCFGLGSNRFIHKEVSSNYRISNIQAALGLSQLNRIDNIIKRKIEIGKRYYQNLKNIKNIYIQPPALNKISNVYWVVGIVFKNIKSAVIAKKLLQKNIQTRPFFYPMNKQPILKKYIKSKEKFPNSSFISKFGLYLPSGIAIKNNHIDYICNILKSILKN
jgi:perosamine synthetase